MQKSSSVTGWPIGAIRGVYEKIVPFSVYTDMKNHPMDPLIPHILAFSTITSDNDIAFFPTDPQLDPTASPRALVLL